MPDNFNADGPDPYRPYTVEDLYQFLSNHTLTCDVGTVEEYSNLGVGLLGHALACRAGKTYEALLRERVLEHEPHAITDLHTAAIERLLIFRRAFDRHHRGTAPLATDGKTLESAQ